MKSNDIIIFELTDDIAELKEKLAKLEYLLWFKQVQINQLTDLNASFRKLINNEPV